jgi:hypothetical protein
MAVNLERLTYAYMSTIRKRRPRRFLDAVHEGQAFTLLCNFLSIYMFCARSSRLSKPSNRR